MEPGADQTEALHGEYRINAVSYNRALSTGAQKRSEDAGKAAANATSRARLWGPPTAEPGDRFIAAGKSAGDAQSITHANIYCAFFFFF